MGRSNWQERTQTRRVGLYMGDENWKHSDAGLPPRTSVVGVIGDCRDLDGANVLMVAGYCHYTDGPILSVSEIRALE